MRSLVYLVYFLQDLTIAYLDLGHYDNTYNDNTYNDNTYNDNTYNDFTYNDFTYNGNTSSPAIQLEFFIFFHNVKSKVIYKYN